MLRSSLVVAVLVASSFVGACTTVHHHHTGPRPVQAASGYAPASASASVPVPRLESPGYTNAAPTPTAHYQPLDPYAAPAYASACPEAPVCDCSQAEARAAYTVQIRGPVTPRQLASPNPADLLE